MNPGLASASNISRPSSPNPPLEWLRRNASILDGRAGFRRAETRFLGKKSHLDKVAMPFPAVLSSLASAAADAAICFIRVFLP
jgi:hypothetical protein